MTIQQIIDLALTNSHTTADQVREVDLIKWFNIVRRDLGNAIIKDVNENFFWQTWIRDALPDQPGGEYPYPEADANSDGMLKCTSLYIKGTSDDQYWTKCTEVDPRAMSRDWEYYLENQPKSAPIYFIGENSFFIAPQFKMEDLPEEPSGNKQIKASGITKFIDITLADDAKVMIPEDFHSLISIGMEPHIYKSRGQREEANIAKQEYEYDKSVMVDTLTNRDDSKMTAKLPDTSALEIGGYDG